MRPPVPQVTHKTDLADPHSPGLPLARADGTSQDVSWASHALGDARQFCGCAWVGRSGVRDRNVQPRKTADCKRQHPASTTAGRGVAVCPLLFRIRILCFSAREHPREVVGQLIRHPRRLRVFHASRAHAHPPHVAVCVPLSRLRAHLRPYPTTAHPTHRPSRGPPQCGRCVGVCRCAPRRPRTSGRWFRPLVCVGGRCLSQAAPKCAPIHRT